MAKQQFNPNTLKASFDPATGKAQAVLSPCDCCPSGTTPETIKVTFSGILVCQNLNVCCPHPESSQGMFTSTGLGYNGEAICTPGQVYWEGNKIVRKDWPCYWSEIVYGDFGHYDIYNLAGCKGGIYKSYDAIAIRTRVFLACGSGDTYCHVERNLVESEVPGDPQFDAIPRAFYGYTKCIECQWENCMPYNITITNNELCPGNCLGDGTAIITEVF